MQKGVAYPRSEKNVPYPSNVGIQVLAARALSAKFSARDAWSTGRSSGLIFQEVDVNSGAAIGIGFGCAFITASLPPKLFCNRDEAFVDAYV